MDVLFTFLEQLSESYSRTCSKVNLWWACTFISRCTWNDKLENYTSKKKKKRMSGKGNLEISAQFISTHNELYFRSKR